jgi:hypothetical protein
LVETGRKVGNLLGIFGTWFGLDNMDSLMAGLHGEEIY